MSWIVIEFLQAVYDHTTMNMLNLIWIFTYPLLGNNFINSKMFIVYFLRALHT